MKFRKKNVVIEAVQFTGDILEICNFMGRDLLGDSRALTIPTLEGSMTAWKGDWIIKGIKGEFYPCKPHIFAATHEPVESPVPVRYVFTIVEPGPHERRSKGGVR